jgi:hypothetical protein
VSPVYRCRKTRRRRRLSWSDRCYGLRVTHALLEILKAVLPLAGVVLGGIITWRSGLRSRALERRQEARAALVGAIEESISATTAYRDDLSRWQSGGWGRPETHSDPRISALTAQHGAFSKAMSEARGSAAAALARLLVVADISDDLSQAIALTEAVLVYGVPGRAAEAELVAAALSLRERSRKLAEGWRAR